MSRSHAYDVEVTWTGNRGSGTSGYTAYDRDHEVSAAGVPTILGSADPAFRGDPARWNPEQLMVASLSQCHMLWYLNLAATAGVVVTAYADRAHGVMVQDADGGGQFQEVVLRPQVTIATASDRETALRVHGEVPAKCFIARSVNFPVRHEPVVVVEGE